MKLHLNISKNIEISKKLLLKAYDELQKEYRDYISEECARVTCQRLDLQELFNYLYNNGLISSEFEEVDIEVFDGMKDFTRKELENLKE